MRLYCSLNCGLYYGYWSRFAVIAGLLWTYSSSNTLDLVHLLASVYTSENTHKF